MACFSDDVNFTRDIARLWSAIGQTPVLPVNVVTSSGRTLALHLKLEHQNPTGSVKDRTALSLIEDLDRRGQLTAGATIVESTSGNAGVALASLAAKLGLHLVAVVDPKAQAFNVDRIARQGAEVVMVTEIDENGGYLKTRLRMVQEIVDARGALWSNQYANPANPGAHYRSTGPEIWRYIHRSECRTVMVPVSTGGTYAGIRRFLQTMDPGTAVIPVDAKGSVAIGGSPGPRELTGIGASRQSDHIPQAWWTPNQFVYDIEAFAVCRYLSDHLGIHLGGSSGAVIAAAVRLLKTGDHGTSALCVCPDGGWAYSGTIYDDAWLTDHFGTAALPMPAGIARIDLDEPTIAVPPATVAPTAVPADGPGWSVA